MQLKVSGNDQLTIQSSQVVIKMKLSRGVFQWYCKAMTGPVWH